MAWADTIACSVISRNCLVNFTFCAGQRLYNVEAYIRGAANPSLVCYCRVSSPKQKDDLQRQIAYMQSLYPEAEIIKDIGSGLNFKRKGLRSILDRLLRGDKLKIIVACRDRLCRFGFELIQYMVEQNGGEILVQEQTVHCPQTELTTKFRSRRDKIQSCYIPKSAVTDKGIYHTKLGSIRFTEKLPTEIGDCRLVRHLGVTYLCVPHEVPRSRVDELHHQIARFLVDNFDIILLPTFETSHSSYFLFLNY